MYSLCRSEGLSLMGYVVPGSMEDGAWMPLVAHPGLKQLFEFHYGIGPSGVRGSIRLVFRVPLEPELRKVVVKIIQILKKSWKKIKNGRKQA